MIVLEVDSWGVWEWLRAVNVVLALLCLGTVIAKARRWLVAPDHERLHIMGTVVLVLAVVHSGTQRSIQGFASGEWTALYTAGLVGVLAGTILTPTRLRRHTKSGDPMPTTHAATADAPAQPERPGQVAKLIAYGIVALLTVTIPVLREQDFSLYAILSALVMLGGAPAVYLIAGTRGKTIAAAVVAGLQVVIASIDTATGLADVTLDTWMAAMLAVAAAFGVRWVPNAPPSTKVEVTTPIVTVLPPAGSADVEHAVEVQHRVNESASKSHETGSTPIL